MLLEVDIMHTAKLFVNGRSQAVRIPRSLAFRGISEVAVRREGNKLILEPLRKTWTSLPEAGVAGDDFMSERPDLMETDRVKL
ncbi:MAG: type II toxin-antitoxin system VapB family antitoxin [Kiloniellales bacterium]|nr:type II toxin-antitoxin system VapB family antitoxin [Kiloniellales bacterium]